MFCSMTERSVPLTPPDAPAPHDLLPGSAFLTVDEVAALLKVSIYTVRRWINDGALPAYKVGRSWRVAPAELNSWLTEQRLS